MAIGLHTNAELEKLFESVKLNQTNKAHLAIEAALSNEGDPVLALSLVDADKLIERAGTTVQYTTAIAIIALAGKAVSARSPKIEVSTTVVVKASSPDDARRDRRTPMFADLMDMTRTASAVVFDKQKVIDFAYLLSVYGYEAARIDEFVLNAVKQGAGRYVQNNWMLEVLDAYRTAKGSAASRMSIPANAERRIEAGDLEIVPEKPRVEYWAQIKNALEASGFYTLVEQLAYFQRAKGKSTVLAGLANVQATLADSRYDPVEMKRLLEKALTTISTFMEDRTHVLNGDRIAREHHVVTLSALTDKDVLYFLCKPPRNVKDVAQYFWATDQVDLTAERAGLRLGETTYQALVALAEYDPNQPFEDQIWPMAKAADPLFTRLQELGTMLPQRYGYTASREEGAKGFFANIFAAINLRVQVNGAGAAGAKMGVEITLPGKVLVVPEDRSDLRVFLTNHFDLEELRTFCFDIGVDMDSLPGEGKAGKCRELVTHFERRAYGIPGLQRLVMKRLGIQ